MHLNGNQLERSRTQHVTSPLPSRKHTDKFSQAFKRHAELGYLALSTDLSNVTLPGNIPYAEWDSWHSLILTDELSRVVRHDAPHMKAPLTHTGIHRCSMGSGWWKWYWSTTDRQFWHSGTEGQVPSRCGEWDDSFLSWNH